MKMLVRILWMTAIASFLTSACRPSPAVPTSVPASPMPLPQNTVTAVPTEVTVSTPAHLALVPNFSHIVIIIFENRDFETVINNPKLPYFNLYANTFALLTRHHAVTHSSLPNYLALIGGDTFDATDECNLSNCPVNAPSLPDLIEGSGRTWKAYLDDMPEPCFDGSTVRYIQTHNPFIFLDPIRLNEARCRESIVPLTQLDVNIAEGKLPNFIFISPDACYSAKDCELELVDGWMKDQMAKIYPALEADGEPFLIILTWDEGLRDDTCCGLPEKAGGRVATILISPQVKSAFQDDTPYSHYSILKTIAEAWGLSYLGHAADAETNLITAPWK
jgi:phosphatidylinositol-3-phosphatase